MSRHKHRDKGKDEAQPAPRHFRFPSWNGPNLLRRSVLVLVTALLVARPLVLGEDPGLLDPLSDAGGLTLTLLWLVATIGWAVWRLWTGHGEWRGGLVEAALLAAVAFFFLSAGVAAHYRHPAWLIAWEWVVLLLALFLVRQLAGDPATQQGFVAAILATGISLAAFAVYQASFELPAQRELFGKDREALRQTWEKEVGRPVAPDDPELEYLAERVQYKYVYATFAHPNSFAGYLVLLLPATLGCALLALRQRASNWHPALALACAALVVIALLLTQSRGAILGTLLAGVVYAAWRARHFLRTHLRWTLGGLAVLAAVVVLAVQVRPIHSTLERAMVSLSLRHDYWSASWQMIQEHPWLGVGPGNFSREYLHYRLPGAAEEIKDPHNFLLDVWATSGLFAMLALLVALAAVAHRLSSIVRHPSSIGYSPATAGQRTMDDGRNWEFYIGGMVGLLLAFLLRVHGVRSADAILLEGVAAGGRSLVWFAACALFLSIPWSRRALVAALAVGVAACLLNLLVSGGISLPQVAQPLWGVIGLALATAAPVLRPVRHRLELFLPVPILTAVTLSYFLLHFLPVTYGDYYLREARRLQNRFRELAGKPTTRIDAVPYLNGSTYCLQLGHKQDPSNVLPLLRLEAWAVELGQAGREGERAFKYLEQARQLDPHGLEILLTSFHLHLRLAQAVPEPKKHLQAAAEDLEALVVLDPSAAARLHYQLANASLGAHEFDMGYRHSLRALAEDEHAPGVAHHLAPLERGNAEKLILSRWRAVGTVLAAAPGGPVQVLPALRLQAEAPGRPQTPPPR